VRGIPIPADPQREQFTALPDIMKTIQLTQGLVALVDDADYDRVSTHRWYALKSGNGVFYALRTTLLDDKKTPLLMHRFILGATDPSMKVDHKNHNGLDNQRENLRLCTQTQNHGNRRKTQGSSKYKGVTKRGSKWEAAIKHNGKSKYLGVFISEVDAARVYDAAARNHFGEFALCNFPMGASA